MNYIQGIEKCKKALVKLSSKDNFAKRVDDAFSEISEIDPKETSVGHLKEAVEWCEEYLSFRDKYIKADGAADSKEKNKELANLAQSLTILCIEIIEYNSIKSSK